MTINKSNQRGFSLIEVMLAVLVLSVGILGVSKLQGQLIRGGAEANQRSVASNLIQQKSDDLRRFVHLTTSDADVPDAWTTTLATPTSLAFVHITSNEGGLIDPGNHPVGNINYDLSWSVKDYYYSGDDTIATTTLSGADYPSFKMAHIVVSWDTVNSTNNVVSFDTIIDSYSLAHTALGGSPSSAGTGPVVDYDPLAAPDVVPISLGIDGLQKETSKPLPDVSKKGDSTLVKFETVTYNPNNDTQRREEFRTLACNCTKQGATATSSIVYGYVSWDDVNEKIVDLTTNVSKSIAKTKVDNSGGEDQNDACTFCCRDGDDVVTAGNTTFKVCRYKRIDGVLRITDPWKLVAFNMIPASYFNDSAGLTGMTTTLQDENIDRYSSYVTTTVRHILAATGSKSALNSYSTVDLAFINDTTTFTNNSGAIEHLLFNVGSSNKRDIQVRGLYMDYPPTGVFTQITGQTTFYDTSTVPLDRVPFYEVNLTQLAGWIPDVNILKNGTNTGDVAFTSDYPAQHDDMESSCTNTSTASAGRNYVTNEDFFYQGGGTTITCNNASRGKFYPISTTTAETIASEIYTGSDGIIDRNINNNTTVDISLDLKVQ